MSSHPGTNETMSVVMEDRRLREGDNCFRIAAASRIAILVDHADYFRSVYESCSRATRSIFVVGWELDPELELLRGPGGEHPSRLAALFESLLQQREELEVRLLPWDYLPAAVGGMLAPLLRKRWPRHPRLHWWPDASHPSGASHHQKIVVVDDTVAFCGGMDLTNRRWDTPEHRLNDPRRRDHEDEAYPPWHDVQMAVEGEMAALLGDLVRRRWLRATGERLPAADTPLDRESPWPPSCEPFLRDAKLALSRTQGAYEGEPEIREIERLYLDAIASAERFLYIENQYLSAGSIRRALGARLREPGGPEVVVVATGRVPNRFEDGLTRVLRVNFLSRLGEHDRYNRLRAYCPVVGAREKARVVLHSKVLIVDDRLLSIGSANVSDRSMALDTEANLTLESSQEGVGEAPIRRFLHRLLGEHLGQPEETVHQTLERTGSLIETIDELSQEERGLTPLGNEYPEWLERLAAGSEVSDPRRPMSPAYLLEAGFPSDLRRFARHRTVRTAALSALGAGAGLALWRWWRRASAGDASDLR